MEHVLVPPSPGNFSAFGALISDVRHEHVQTHVAELGDVDASTVERRFADMERDAAVQMAAEGMAPELIATARACGMRYVGQSWDLIVPLPDRIDDIDILADRFRDVHERRFGYAMEGGAEIVSFRVSVTGRSTSRTCRIGPMAARLKMPSRASARSGFQAIRWRLGFLTERSCHAARRSPGPAIVEEMGAVTVVPPGWRAEVGRYGELHLRRVRS